MAINIKSGSTWAEIRRHLNEESWNKDGDTMRGGLTLAKDPDGDMEAVTKQFGYNNLFEFVPGTKNKIFLGSTPSKNISITPDSPGFYTLEQEFNRLPITNGEVIPIVEVGRISLHEPPQVYGSYSGDLSIKIYIQHGETERVIWEEHNDSYVCDLTPLVGTESIFRYSGDDDINVPKVIQLDTLPIMHGTPFILKYEITIHSLNGGHGRTDTISFRNS